MCDLDSESFHRIVSDYARAGGFAESPSEIESMLLANRYYVHDTDAEGIADNG